MPVQFFQDKAQENRWRVVDEDDGYILHTCHEGFSSGHNALQNLLINHAMMSVFVAHMAAGGALEDLPGDSVYFEMGNDQLVWWKIKAKNGEIVGKSHKGFDSNPEAADNLIVVYTMLAMFIAIHAQEQNK